MTQARTGQGTQRTEEAYVWFKSRGWIPVAWLLCVGNLIAAWFPQPIAPWHSASHAIAALLFGLGAQRLAQRKPPAADTDVADALRELEDRLGDLDRLQDLDGRLTQLEERLDFTERALVEVRTRAQLRPKE